MMRKQIYPPPYPFHLRKSKRRQKKWVHRYSYSNEQRKSYYSDVCDWAMREVLLNKRLGRLVYKEGIRAMEKEVV